MRVFEVRSPLVFALLLPACGTRPFDFEATGTDSDTSTSSTSSTSTSIDPSTSTDPSTGSPPNPTNNASSSGTPFIVGGDLPGPPECDTWTEDCPEGQKCMPVSLDGDNSWENLMCVPIAPNPAQPGEPCNEIGTGVDGLDTCDKHAVCWNVNPDTQTGTCLSMCIGTPDTPACADPNATCILPSDGVLNLCLPNCDPIAQDCPNMDLCIPNPQNSASFLCILDASGAEGQTFDPCEFANACDPGKVCLPPDLASECDPMKAGCCLPFCDLSKPNTCPGQGLECLPWYKDGMAPPQYQNVGVCGLPMP